MKPTHHISSALRGLDGNRAVPSGPKQFPATEFHYRATTEPRGGALSKSNRYLSEVRTFREVATRFSGNEASRIFVAELVLFILITAVSAWSIMSMIAALRQMLK
ncbi:MAG: hypothetical protein DMF04_01755 [Verrucomicrobia bacterium]|nr:MAG: hypothetical protein DMF04_01755 [Verrucomicrobiota bacterium]